MVFHHYSRIQNEISWKVLSIVNVVKWFYQTQKRLGVMIFHFKNIQVIQNNKLVIQKMESLSKVLKR